MPPPPCLVLLVCRASRVGLQLDRRNRARFSNSVNFTLKNSPSLRSLIGMAGWSQRELLSPSQSQRLREGDFRRVKSVAIQLGGGRHTEGLTSGQLAAYVPAVRLVPCLLTSFSFSAPRGCSRSFPCGGQPVGPLRAYHVVSSLGQRRHLSTALSRQLRLVATYAPSPASGEFGATA